MEGRKRELRGGVIEERGILYEAEGDRCPWAHEARAPTARHQQITLATPCMPHSSTHWCPRCHIPDIRWFPAESYMPKLQDMSIAGKCRHGFVRIWHVLDMS